MNRLIIGCGYLGARVAQRWHQAGDLVHCVTRSPQRAEEFALHGWRPIVADVTLPDTLRELPPADTVLFAVARGRDAGVPIRSVYVEGLRAVLDALPSATGGVVLISSTGVYAQDDGSWVDETSECRPVREGGQASLAGEALLAAHPHGRSSTVLRMAGLYGPLRVPRRNDLFSGQAVADPGDGFLNLIHIDDAADAVVAAAARLAGQQLYNISDGAPVLRRAYLQEIASVLGAPEPAFLDAPRTVDPSGIPASDRGSTSKRVRNRRMIEELGLSLLYPSYREGLRAILLESGPQ